MEDYENKNEIKDAWEYYRHADNLNASRVNFFLVAESMLVVSFVTTPSFGLRIPISILGIIFSFAWLYVTARLSKRMKYLLNSYLTKDPIYKKYMESVSCLSSNIILSWILPISTILFWIFLIFWVGNNFH